MQHTWQLQDGELAASIDDAGVLRVSRRGAALPWCVDLGPGSAWVAVRTAGVEARHPVRLERLAARRLGPARLQWLGEVGGAGVALEVELAGGALRCSVTPLSTGAQAPVAACWPGDVSGTGAARELAWGGDGSWGHGRLFRSDGKPWEYTTQWNQNSLRLAGFTCDRASLALLLDTPYDAASEMADDGAGRITHRLVQNASLGELRYARAVTLVPMAGPGYVAMANLFRDYARKNGMWMSWEERVAENPALAALPGAFFGLAGYLHDDEADIVGAMRKMKAYGFERGYLYSPKLRTLDDASWGRLIGRFNAMTDAQLRDIQALGYVCAPFLQVEEATDAIGAHLLASDTAGQPVFRWQIGEVKYHEIVKWRVRDMVKRLDADLVEAKGVHFDTLAAMPLVEHAGPGSYDRAGDVRERCELARYYRRQGKIVVAEGVKDWAVTTCDIGTSHPFAPRMGPRTGVTRGADRVWNVPLADLVYHDSIIRCCWEHHYYHDDHCLYDYDLSTWHPFAMPLMDTLTASPPVLFPEGKMYYYLLEDKADADGRVTRTVRWDQARLYRNRFSDPALQAVLPEALRVCTLNLRHGTARMLSHRFLDPASSLVQETTFASGLRVVANFGDEPFTCEDGKTVAGRAVRTEE